MILHQKDLFFLFAFLSISFLSLDTAKSQVTNAPPSGQFGIGVYAAEDYACGVEGVYAASPNIQVGSLLSFTVRSDNTPSFLLGPFFRYLFDSKVSPFLQGKLVILSGRGNTDPGILLGGGVAFYLNQTIGVHADIDVINLWLNPSLTIFGVKSFVAGADWFF